MPIQTGHFSSTQWLHVAAAAAVKSLQSCPTLCDPVDGSPPGSAIPGILQARTSEWVAISFSNAWKWKVKVKSPSHVRLFATPWTAAHWAPPSMGFSRQEYWSGMPLPSLLHVASDYYVGSVVLGYLSAYPLGLGLFSPSSRKPSLSASHTVHKVPLLSLFASSVQISVYRTEGRSCVSFHH